MASFDTASWSGGAGWQTPGYAHLLELDRAGWAWEWLRRNRDFASLNLASVSRTSTGRSIVILQEAASERALLRWGLHYA